MAVPSKSSVRSTRQNNAVADTGDDADRSSERPHLGKRPRNTSSTNGVFVPSKKQRAERTLPARPKVAVREGHIHNKQLANSAALLSDPQGTRGGRVTSAVQPPATGTIIANSSQPSSLSSANGDSCLDLSTQDRSSAHQLEPPVATDKRSLRSQDGGSRSKSELSLYFPNYEEFISNEPKQAELLTAETRLFVTEEPPKSPVTTKTFIHASPTKVPSPKTTPRKHRPSFLATPKAVSPTTFSRLDLDSMIPKFPSNATDPLHPQLFQKAHRRAERQEKQLKNIEKERAQHEKVQLERLFDGLRGPDWLRVMGISGITEGERKSWEGKRAWCIREVGALLEKFRLWKEEERRRKLEKEMSAHDEEDAQEVEEASQDEVEELAGHASPASSDVDAMAALQLHNETLSASTNKSKSSAWSRTHSSKPKPATKELPTASLPLPAAEAMQRPMTSFFSKPHQRAAALDRNRRSGRNKLAFGHPVPEPFMEEFQLPEEMLTEETRRSNARSRRRARRGTLT